MSNIAAKPETAEAAAPRKRSRLKLALAGLAPLLLAGGGYAGWTMLPAGAPEAEAATGEHDPVDQERKAAEALALRAENSFTHTLALAVMIRKECGKVYVPALLAASADEAQESGQLVNLSWMAAARRVDDLSARSCGYLLAEIGDANGKAIAMAEEKAAAEKGGKGKGGGGHH